jgi:nicotinamidase-related amidase
MIARIATARPYPYEFPPEKSALLLIDMQRDFIEAGGFGAALGNDVSHLAAVIPQGSALLEGWRAAGLLVCHTKEAHRPDLSNCPPAKLRRGNARLRIGDVGPMGRILISGEPGNDFVAPLKPRDGEFVIEKPGKGAFYATALDELLRARGVSHLIIGGVTTEVCVQTTMREANDRGYECLLVEDATESYFPAFRAATIEMIRAQGAIVGWTATVDEVLTALHSL